MSAQLNALPTTISKIKQEIQKCAGQMQNTSDEKTFLFWSSRRQAFLSVLHLMKEGDS